MYPRPETVPNFSHAFGLNIRGKEAPFIIVLICGRNYLSKNGIVTFLLGNSYRFDQPPRVGGRSN